MITLRPANTRGHLNPGWIESRRTFSNNSYWNPRYMNWGFLEVINDDILQPGNRVPNHLHKNMEILGYVVDGPCDHTDNLGNAGPAESGWVQRMSAGSGIWHTEGNESTRPIRYLQLWIRPDVTDTAPNYTKMYFGPADKLNKFCPIASKEGPIVIKQNAKVSAGLFTQNYLYSLLNRRKYYLYMVRGSATINNVSAEEGDGIAIENEQGLTIADPNDAEILLFEV